MSRAVRFRSLSFLALLALALLPSAATAQSHRRLVPESHRREIFRHEGIIIKPLWERGALLGVDFNMSDAPIIVRVDKESRNERIAFEIPGGRAIGIAGLSSAEDGRLAVVGTAYSNAGQPGSFLALIPPRRERMVVVQLWPYIAGAVTISSDGRIWTIGWVKRGDYIAQYYVLKQVDSSGTLLKTVSVDATVRQDLGRSVTDATNLRSSRDRVGWLTNLDEYIEWGLDGREIGRFSPPRRGPLSVCDTRALEE